MNTLHISEISQTYAGMKHRKNQRAEKSNTFQLLETNYVPKKHVCYKKVKKCLTREFFLVFWGHRTWSPQKNKETK